MKTHLAPTESLTVVIDDKEITVTAPDRAEKISLEEIRGFFISGNQ